MKIKHLLVFFLLFNVVYGQECHHESSPLDINRTTTFEPPVIPDYSHIGYQIPLNYHVWYDTIVPDYITETMIDSATIKLNEALNKWGFYFYENTRNIDYNERLAVTNHSEDRDYIKQFEVEDGIDVHIVRGLTSQGSGILVGLASFIDFRVMINYGSFEETQYNVPRTLIHEILHVIGALHTFDGYVARPERCERDTLQGGNCHTAGDYICDTNPDDHYHNNGNWVDDTGAICVMPKDNYMSYGGEKRDTMTLGQANWCKHYVVYHEDEIVRVDLILTEQSVFVEVEVYYSGDKIRLYSEEHVIVSMFDIDGRQLKTFGFKGTTFVNNPNHSLKIFVKH